jgi:hypothetical protein
MLVESVADQLRDLQAKVAAVQDKLDEISEEIRQRPVVRPVTIVDLGTPALCLTQAVHIVIEQYDDEITASWPEVEAFGAGDSDGEAIVALKRDIVALYEDLAAMPETKLGPLLLDQKRILNRMIARHEAS